MREPQNYSRMQKLRFHPPLLIRLLALVTFCVPNPYRPRQAKAAWPVWSVCIRLHLLLAFPPPPQTVCFFVCFFNLSR